MHSRIVLIRHGRSAHTHAGGWLTARAMHEWRVGYDAAGLADGDAPPAALTVLASTAQWLAASDLPRAVVSAERLAPGREVLQSALLRETSLAIPGSWPFPLPLMGWAALIHLQWGYRILRGTDTAPGELRRAADAAAWLIALADDGGSVAAVTHGVFRRLLAMRLRKLGWEAEPGRQDYRHWSAWAFRSPGGDSVAAR